jgi:hypothetical protein
LGFVVHVSPAKARWVQCIGTTWQQGLEVLQDTENTLGFQVSFSRSVQGIAAAQHSSQQNDIKVIIFQ